MNEIIRALFSSESRAVLIYQLRGNLIALRATNLLNARRMSYLQSRHPEIHAHLTDKKSPVVMLRQADKDRIAADIDEWLEPLK